MIFQNYHKHTFDSNIFTADSSTSIGEYAERCIELGHTVLTSMEHGYQGRYYDVYEVAKKYNLKFIFGTEAYWVKDRLEKDRTNSHICVFARNENGRKQINRILSDANIDGYYYRPRLDLNLILSLNPNDVFITSACVAFWHYEDVEDIVLKLHNHFKNNFMLEVQYHHTDKQKELNQRILNIANKYNISIIMGCDSHYIYPEQEKDRGYILDAKNIKYEDEDGWFMDYPDGTSAFNRFKEQGILSDNQIIEAMNNTNVFLEFDDIEFDKKIKLPKPPKYKHLSQEERNMVYAQLVADEWQKEKENIPKEQHKHYKQEIIKEVSTIMETNMSDYFLIDHAIVEDAVENGGIITPTGRGSGVSYYTNTLLGFSKIDRISSPVKLYPERFISKSRILETASLPDLDLNCGNPEVFAESQKRILGEGHSYPMIAFGTFKAKSAWKMYAKANDIPFDIANTVSNQIEEYETELKYADEDDKDLIVVYDYIDKKHHELVKESEKYQGITSDKKAHPCGYLIYDGNIKEEIGLILCKSESTKKETLTTVIDGSVAEKYKFLKNDLLKVDVVMLIDKIYKRIGIPTHTVRELTEIIKDNDKVWDIYANGLTLGVNQVEKESTTKKAMRYKPKNISELTAFVAAIRPSFQSIYHIFEARKPFNYNIPSFDKLIQTPEMPNSFILYQEQVMTTLSYAGFPTDQTYGIIKAISKKKPEVVLKLKDQFIDGFSKQIIKSEHTEYDTAIEMSEQVWQIIEDSSAYGFNASHAYSYAYDSVYCAYLKSHYPLEFYEVLLEEYSKKGKKDKVMALKKEMQVGFGISSGEIKFGLDNRGFRFDRENNKINQSLLSLKFFNYKVSDQLYKLSQNNKYNNFVDLIIDIKEKTSANARHLKILIDIDYFKDFGGGKKILKFIDIFNEFHNAKEISLDKIIKNNISEDDISKFARISSTGKTYLDFDSTKFLHYIYEKLSNAEFNILEKIKNEIEHIGYANIIQQSIPKDFAVVVDINENRWGTRFITLYRPNNGEYEIAKVIKSTYEDKPIEKYEMIKTIESKVQNKKRKVDGKFITLDETEVILTQFARVVV